MREINLLPPLRRASLRREALFVSLTRFLNSVLGGIMALTVAGMLTGGALWLGSYFIPSNQETTLAQEVTAYQQLRDEVGTVNFFLEQISTLTQQRLVWSELLAGLLKGTPPGVRLNSITGSALTDTAGHVERSLTVSGQAEARGTLTLLQDRLRVLPGVETVEAPSSNFLQRENPTFQFSVKLK